MPLRISFNASVFSSHHYFQSFQRSRSSRLHSKLRLLRTPGLQSSLRAQHSLILLSSAKPWQVLRRQERSRSPSPKRLKSHVQLFSYCSKSSMPPLCSSLFQIPLSSPYEFPYFFTLANVHFFHLFPHLIQNTNCNYN